MDIDEKELERIADEMGCTVEDLKLMGERVEDAAGKYTSQIAKAESGTLSCFGCGGEAQFRRTGQSYVIECECGVTASGQVPENMIQHTRH